MDSSTSHPDWPDTGRRARETSRRRSGEARPARVALALWTGVLTGPLAWLFLLQVNYVLAHVACQTRSWWFMHVATAVALALVLLSGYAAWAAGRTDRSATGAPVDRGTAGTRAQQTRWMSLAGMTTSAWFGLVIVAMEMPLLMLEPCR